MEKTNLLKFITGGTINADNFAELEKALIEGKKAKESFAIRYNCDDIEFYTKEEFESKLVDQYRNLWLAERESRVKVEKEYFKYYKLYRDVKNELAELKKYIERVFETTRSWTARKCILKYINK